MCVSWLSHAPYSSPNALELQNVIFFSFTCQMLVDVPRGAIWETAGLHALLRNHSVKDSPLWAQCDRTAVYRSVSANSRFLPYLKRVPKPAILSHGIVRIGRLRRCLSSTSAWSFRKHCCTSTVVSVILQVLGTSLLTLWRRNYFFF